MKSIIIAGLCCAALLAGCDSEPSSQASKPGERRLTESQYRHVIADLFGGTIVVGGRFDPLNRINGLMALGAASATVSAPGFEQYDRMARSVAEQVVSPANRAALIPCRPVSATAPDDACASKFLAAAGRGIFRRAFVQDEIRAWTAAASDAARRTGDFYEGVGFALAGMLVAPEFLFQIDVTEPDPKGGVRLTGYAKAARLSFLLWDSSPDEALLSAAERGELHDAGGLKRQVDRMLASERFERGVRAFFSDMLALDNFDYVEKDPIIYPTFSTDVARDAKEQMLRTIADHVIARDGDYRELFTTRRTFLSGPLGWVYKVPVPRPDGGWIAYELPADDPRAGLVNLISFTALYAHPGRSSPTLRGRAMRESLLCQKVPDPPGDVDFSVFNDPNSPSKTARQRLSAHATAPSCAGCHRLTDPIGLALERVDGAGQARTTENGVPIETAGDLDGVPFADGPGLAKALHDSAAAQSCVVNRLASYAFLREPVAADRELLKYFEKEFARNGFRIPDLLRQIATSKAMFAVTPPETATAEVGS